MATATAEKKGKAAEAPAPDTEITGEVFTWKSWEGRPEHDRDYTVITIPYGDYKQWFYVKPYVDLTGEGWQRGQDPGHVNKLLKAMSQDVYTPTAFYGGLHRNHVKEMRIEAEPDGTRIVHIKVGPRKKLPCTDGGHRDKSLEKQLNRALGRNDKGQVVGPPDEARVRSIRERPITVMIMLSDKHLVSDFLNLQQGKGMNRNLMASMEMRHGLVDPRKRPVLQFCHDVCKMLVDDPRSHFHNAVTFDASSAGRLMFRSLANDSSSNTGCSLWGGALIARQFHKDERWLADRYVEAYQALSTLTEKDPASKLPTIFLPNMALTPWSVRESGSKGASAFIVGTGNLLAWRLGYLGLDRAPADTLKRIAEIADEHYQIAVIGWDATMKRANLGDFARQFFSDMIRTAGDGPSPETVEGFEGIPNPLLRVLAPSTFAIPLQLSKEFRKREKAVVDRFEEDEEEEIAPPPKAKAKAKAGR